ncbi:hypothetical protein HKCCE2091_01460 [Rhodobacterales bacterium HKCCE2091]|nr:hypothetical protein [Rhodobacterales bacterium HKCCE2091]
MPIFYTVLPIFLAIAAGYALRRTGVVPADGWSAINLLCYRVLFPVAIVEAIAPADLSFGGVIPLVAVIMGSLGLVAALVVALRGPLRRAGVGDPAFTTLFAVATRWNGFMALAAAELYLGDAGVTILALIMALSIPLINIANIVILVAHGSAAVSVRMMLLAIAKNPIVIGCVIGLVLNRLPVPLEGWPMDTLDLVGRAALGVALLAVGGGVSLRRLSSVSAPLVLGIAARPVLLMALAAVLGWMVGLDRFEILIAALVFAVPTAANGYVIAREMGGDSGLYADIMTWQVVLSLAVLPLAFAIVGLPV